MHVDRLVNNAGIQGAAAVWKMDSKMGARAARESLRARSTTRAFSQAMVERGFGRIVNCLRLRVPFRPGQSPLRSRKRASSATHSTALDLAPHGVTVNVIAPA